MKKFPLANLTFFILLIIFTVSINSCSSQVPDWVIKLSNDNLGLDIKVINTWEEKTMTFYEIDSDGDSISINALYVTGITKDGYSFIGKIPEINHIVEYVGGFGIGGESCTGKCGCQFCQFKKKQSGCFCAEDLGGGVSCCVLEADPCTDCWCSHTVTRE